MVHLWNENDREKPKVSGTQPAPVLFPPQNLHG
jgi:hypothetical protein